MSITKFNQIKTSQILVILYALFLSFVTFNIATTYSFKLYNWIYGIIIALAVFLITIFGKIKVGTIKYFVIYWIAETLLVVLNRLEFRFLSKYEQIENLLAYPEKYFSFALEPLLVIIISCILSQPLLNILQDFKDYLKPCLARKFFKNRYFWLYFNLFLVFIFSSIYIFWGYLNHQSFGNHVYDFGIFDQNFYQLSKFRFPPPSSTRQYVSLWNDHQHFSLIFLAWLYWFGNGFNGTVMYFLPPLLLVTIPSIILYLSFTKLLNYLNLNPYNYKFYWLLSFISFILFLHPFTQSAIGFAFHEKYLINLFFPLLFYTLIQAIFKNQKYFIASTFVTLIWCGIKEDQFLFASVFWLQIIVCFFLLYKTKYINAQKFRQFNLFASINILICLLYNFAFLSWFRKDFVNDQYFGVYINTLKATKELLKTGNILYFVEQVKLFEAVNSYLYQNFLVFDLWGFFGLPLNISGNYAQRVLAEPYPFKSPIFHYGSEVPIYSIFGVLLLWTIFKHKKLWFANNFLTSYLISFFIGFGMIIGWLNSTYYVIPKIPYAFINYKNTANERNSFNQIVKNIPKDGSVVTSANYATHLTARDKIINWPKSIAISNDLSGNVDPDSYRYWLLPKKTLEDNKNSPYPQKIQELRTQNIKIIAENEYQILFDKECCLKK
jgi:Predicted membrane protein (DUF2079)